MQNKFNQPVSMQVTREQYERDLREPLLAMGYKEKLYLCWMGNSCDYLVTNFNKEDNKIGCLSKSSIHRLNRYFIPEYNPKLFLAIAAMTDSISPIVGEWLVCIDEMAYIISGYKVGEFVKNGNPNMILNWFRRATLQELIEKFNNKESIKENTMKKELTQELIKDLKNLIAPENVKKFDELMGIEKPMFQKEDFKTGDKVIFRNGETYLVIRDCNAGYYGAQVFVLVRCEVSGGFITSDGYDEQLLQKQGVKNYDIMKIYRWKNGAIVGDSFSESTRDYKLIWERE